MVGDRLSESLTMSVRLDSCEGRATTFRRFTLPSLEDSTYYVAACSLLEDDGFPTRFASALEAVHHPQDASTVRDIVAESAQNLKNSLVSDQPMPWYLAEFLRRIHRMTADASDRDRHFVITVNACREYYWYTLECEERDADQSAEAPPSGATQSMRRLLCHTPFFENAAPRGGAPRMRGIADTLLFLAPTLSGLQGASYEDVVGWFDIELSCVVTAWGEQSFDIAVSPSVSAISKRIRAGDTEVLMSSPNVREAVASLRDSWLAPTPQSLLVCAWTGSGKEVLVSLVRSARMATRECRCLEISAASMDGTPALFRRLLAAKEDVGLEDDSVETFIFLDEIHHSSAEGLRAGLLRLLENGEFDTADEKCRASNVTYVFAGSLSLDKMRARPPADFWTRIQNTVVLRHPLLIDDRQIREQVLEDYFLLFWRKALCKWQAANDVATEHIVEFLATESTCEALSEVFSQHLSSPLIRLLSVRELRTIVERVLGLSVHKLRTRSDLNPQVALQVVLEELDSWIVRTFNEVVPEMDARAPF